MKKKQISAPHKRVFESITQLDVPQSRNGKHRKIVTRILEEVKSVAPAPH